MVGFTAFLMQLLSVAVPGFILAALVSVAYIQRKSWHSKPRFQRVLEVAVLLVIGSVTFLAGKRLFRQYEAHRALRTLRAESVRSIRIGGRTVSDPQQLARIVASLNGETWFSSFHGGWAQPVSLDVFLKNGSPLEYEVAAYLREEGAVIVFEPDGSGYAYSRTLPSVLNSEGTQLLPGRQ